ncbi:MAG: hypothetical protein MZW92_45915 [Comamonadaceae bacterium]|nr:hypothetical protein [Comamonadaceae bacterium]
MECLLAARHASAHLAAPATRPALLPLGSQRLAPESEVILFCTSRPPARAGSRGAAIRPLAGAVAALCGDHRQGPGRRADGLPADGPGTSAHGRRDAFAVLYGPMISEEIRAGRPAFAECGTAPIRAPAPASAALYRRHGPAPRTGAPTSPAWRGRPILKNVYALAFGMSDELGARRQRARLSGRRGRARARHDIVRQRGRTGGHRLSRLAGLGDLDSRPPPARGSHHHELGRPAGRAGNAPTSAARACTAWRCCGGTAGSMPGRRRCCAWSTSAFRISPAARLVRAYLEQTRISAP